MGLTLTHQPGYSDVDPTVFDAGSTALGMHVARLSDNAALGVCRMEIFEGFYENGQTVALPTSPIDGYAYSRSELIYIWNVHYTFNDSKGWATGPGPLWFAAWKVDQSTGLVSIIEDYRTSNFPPKTGDTTEGNLKVFTVAQRGLTELVVASGPPAYQDLTDTHFATDKACNQTLMQSLNTNAKYGCVKAECFYMGEFKNGDIVSPPTSPADGYAYLLRECTFVFSWRWTTVGATPFKIPDVFNLENLNDVTCSINQTTGAVSISVDWEKSGANVSRTDYGRVAVFCFTRRNGLAPISNWPSVDLTTSHGVFASFAVAFGIKGAAIGSTSTTTSIGLACDTSPLYIVSADVYQCALGSTVVQAKARFKFGGNDFTYILPDTVGAGGRGGVKQSDELLWTFDSSHDYYIIVTYDGTAAPVNIGGTNWLPEGLPFDTAWTPGNVFRANNNSSPANSGASVGGDLSLISGWGTSTGWTLLANVRLNSNISPPTGGGSFPAFTELDPNVFMPGQPLTATELGDINTNTKVAILTPEFFGPTDYANGATIPVPTSPIDGYVYSRSELHYIYELRTTKPATNIRMYQWLVSVNKSTGAVTIDTTRCSSGGGAVFANDGVISVLVVGQRSRQANTITDSAATNTPPALPSPDGLASNRLKANGV